jgi:putative nucleotidyltransferase with HDIG domain
MTTFFGHCLVIERDIFFLEKLLKETDSTDSTFIVTKTLTDAFNILKRPQSRIKMVFISLSFGNVETTQFIAKSQELDEFPFCVLVHQERLRMSEGELQRLGAREQLVCPQGRDDLLVYLKKLFPERHNWTKIAVSPEEKGTQVELLDQDFMPIGTDTFLLTEKCFFNVFLRIGENKFLKILNAGDPFDSDFAEKYTAKKVSNLWVKKSEHHQYIHLTEKNAASGLARGAADSGKRITHLGDNVAKSLGRVGLSEDNLIYADRFLGHTVSYLRQIRTKDASAMKLFEDLARAEHPAAVSVIAGLLAQELGFESTKAIKIIGLAALLHDVAIYQKQAKFPSELVEDLHGADLELFNSHCADGVKILTEMEIFEEAVIQAVAQHHQKHSIQAGRATTLISEIVAASDMFCHIVLNSSEPRLDFFLHRKVSDFRPQIGDAFEVILKRKARSVG